MKVNVIRLRSDANLHTKWHRIHISFALPHPVLALLPADQLQSGCGPHCCDSRLRRHGCIEKGTWPLHSSTPFALIPTSHQVCVWVCGWVCVGRWRAALCIFHVLALTSLCIFPLSCPLDGVLERFSLMYPPLCIAFEYIPVFRLPRQTLLLLSSLRPSGGLRICFSCSWLWAYCSRPRQQCSKYKSLFWWLY